MTIRQRADRLAAEMPDPAAIRVPSAATTIRFTRGIHKFTVVEADSDPVFEFLDDDGTVLAWQHLRVPVEPGDTITVNVPEGPAWTLVFET